MVARGDLGVEMETTRVPGIQRDIIKLCHKRLKPVIVATQMLETMIKSPRPTRAEVSDLATAVRDGADALMLSGETAVGDYACEAVGVMAGVALDTERYVFERGLRPGFLEQGAEDAALEAMTDAATVAADTLGTDYLAAYTIYGRTARFLSKNRMKAAVFVVTPEPETARRIALYWGIRPVPAPDAVGDLGDLERIVTGAIRACDPAPEGKDVVLLYKNPFERTTPVNAMCIFKIAD